MTTRLERTVTYGILALFTVIALTPVIGILSTAFGSQNSLDTGFSLPKGGLHWNNFADAWSRGHFGTYLGTRSWSPRSWWPPPPCWPSSPRTPSG